MSKIQTLIDQDQALKEASEVVLKEIESYEEDLTGYKSFSDLTMEEFFGDPMRMALQKHEEKKEKKNVHIHSLDELVNPDYGSGNPDFAYDSYKQNK